MFASSRVAPPVPRLTVPLVALAAVSALFYYRQNWTGQIGGPISPAKILWLDYALVAWLLVPFALWRAPGVHPGLRRIYGAHLAGFAARGAIEIWLLYGRHAWIPPYGIAHDLLTIALITVLLRRAEPSLRETPDRVNREALRFLTSIRLGLCCEALFAWLFFRAVSGRTGVTWFASSDPRFAAINALTWMVVIVAYADLVRKLAALWRAPTMKREAANG